MCGRIIIILTQDYVCFVGFRMPIKRITKILIFLFGTGEAYDEWLRQDDLEEGACSRYSHYFS